MLQFESASELRAHYAGVRSRLYPRRVRFEPAPVVVEPPAPVVVAPEPPVVEAESTPAPSNDDNQEPHIPTVRDIQKAVCAHYGLTYIDMVTHRRTLSVVRPRQVAMYLARNMTPRTLPEIGRVFGDRDHSTILHGIRKIEALIPVDTDIATSVEKLKSELAHA